MTQSIKHYSGGNKMKTFIQSLLSRQLDEVEEKVEKMKEKYSPGFYETNEETEHYFEALSDVLKIIKEMR